MKTIQWLVSLVPKQARVLVAVLMIAISALSGVVVYLHKENSVLSKRYEQRIITIEEEYSLKLDSLNQVILKEKEQSKEEVVSALQGVIDQQNKMLSMQAKHKAQQAGVINVNNTIIQKNEQKLKQLKNE